jgi:hypothetical protein
VLSDSDTPEDKYNLVYIVFIMYGIGVLLPWNVILSCLDFLMAVVSSLCVTRVDFFTGKCFNRCLVTILRLCMPLR